MRESGEVTPSVPFYYAALITSLPTLDAPGNTHPALPLSERFETFMILLRCSSFVRSLTLILLVLFAHSFTADAASRYAKYNGLYMNSKGTPLLAMIGDTKTGNTIDIEIYTIKNTNVMNALIAAQSRGARIRIVQEPTPFDNRDPCRLFDAPGASDSAYCKLIKGFRLTLVEHGAKYVPYNTQALCPLNPPFTSCFEHGKVMIIDGVTALISTGNFDPSNLCDMNDITERCNRDYSVVTDHPAILQALNKVFIRDFRGERYDVRILMNPAVSRLLTVGPYSQGPLIDFIASAKSKILIQNQYLTDFKLNDAILAAARRGVKVYISVSSACAFGKPSDKSASVVTAVYSRFDAAGVQSRMFTNKILINGHPGYLHAKAIVVDDQYAWVGSTNGSQMALTQNREFGIFISDPKAVGRLRDQIQDDIAHPNTESWQESLDCKKDL